MMQCPILRRESQKQPAPSHLNAAPSPELNLQSGLSRGSLSPSSRPLTSEVSAQGFPGGAVVKNPPANAGDMGSSPGLGRSHLLRSN